MTQGYFAGSVDEMVRNSSVNRPAPPNKKTGGVNAINALRITIVGCMCLVLALSAAFIGVEISKNLQASNALHESGVTSNDSKWLVILAVAVGAMVLINFMTVALFTIRRKKV